MESNHERSTPRSTITIPHPPKENSSVQQIVMAYLIKAALTNLNPPKFIQDCCFFQYGHFLVWTNKLYVHTARALLMSLMPSPAPDGTSSIWNILFINNYENYLWFNAVLKGKSTLHLAVFLVSFIVHSTLSPQNIGLIRESMERKRVTGLIPKVILLQLFSVQSRIQKYQQHLEVANFVTCISLQKIKN